MTRSHEEGRRAALRFIVERDAVRDRKERDEPFPWTSDPVIGENRFCNVRREDDRTTKWLADNWRNDDLDNWFAMAVARLALNRISTMRLLGYPVPWDEAKFKEVGYTLRDKGLPIFGQAYMIIPPKHPEGKVGSLAENLLTPLWNRRDEIRPTSSDTLESFYNRLVSIDGVGSFKAGQVVADVKYSSVLRNASDWQSWATPGPGSLRGLSRVFQNNPDRNWKRPEWFAGLTDLRLWLATQGWDLHAQDVQNCMCEFDKYERVQNGEGKAKQRYNPLVKRDA